MQGSQLFCCHRQLLSKGGLLFNTRKYYIGYSATILNRNYLNGEKVQESFVPWQTIQTGYTFQKNPESDFSFTPQLAFSIGLGDEGTFFSGKRNLTARYKRYLAGVNTAGPFIGVQLGYQINKWRLMLSQHVTSIDEGDIPGKGNISLRYLFNKADKPGITF